jgi:hypothetical protein
MNWTIGSSEEYALAVWLVRTTENSTGLPTWKSPAGSTSCDSAGSPAGIWGDGAIRALLTTGTEAEAAAVDWDAVAEEAGGATATGVVADGKAGNDAGADAGEADETGEVGEATTVGAVIVATVLAWAADDACVPAFSIARASAPAPRAAPIVATTAGRAPRTENVTAGMAN